MGPSEANITSFQWRPPLIPLTVIGVACVDGGAPTVAYIDPMMIMRVMRTHGGVACTDVLLNGGWNVLVTETPERVAQLRERAMGLEPSTPLRVVP